MVGIGLLGSQVDHLGGKTDLFPHLIHLLGIWSKNPFLLLFDKLLVKLGDKKRSHGHIDSDIVLIDEESFGTVDFDRTRESFVAEKS